MSRSKKGNPEMGTENPSGERPSLLMRLALRQQRRQVAGRRVSRVVLAMAVAVAACLSAGAAYAYFTTTGSGNGTAQAASVTNLTITAVTTSSPTNKLYPGASGDVLLNIQNQNSFNVTVTAITLPASTTYAAGYSDPSLASQYLLAGCTSDAGLHPSFVAWSFASTSGAHTLHTALTVGANSTLTVTMTADASMGISSPTGCEGAYFLMPTLPSVNATTSTSPATASPATDFWNS
jgi:hypothetical protein